MLHSQVAVQSGQCTQQPRDPGQIHARQPDSAVPGRTGLQHHDVEDRLDKGEDKGVEKSRNSDGTYFSGYNRPRMTPQKKNNGLKRNNFSAK